MREGDCDGESVLKLIKSDDAITKTAHMYGTSIVDSVIDYMPARG